jgi:hypothetical protein
MHDVGFTDVSPDWYGNSSAQSFLNQTVIDEASDLSTRASGYLSLMIMIDKGLITSGMAETPYSSAAPACDESTTTSPCVIAVLEAAYDYIDHNWGRQSYYSTDPVTLDPMTLTFIGESNFPNVCWDTTLDASVCNNSQLQPNPPVWSTLYSYMSENYKTPYKIVQEWNGTFGEVDGAYAWPQDISPFENSTDGTQFCWAYSAYEDGECSYDYISDYYQSAQAAGNGQIQMGTFYVGFDGSNNNYNHGVMARQCGQLFQFLGGSSSTGALEQAPTPYSSTNQLPWILLATWNDYGEGTNIENGVDNCWRIPTPTMDNTTVYWSATAESSPVSCPSPDTTCASSTTIDQFKIWYGSGAGDLALSEENILPSGSYCTPGSGVINCSFDLSNATYPPPSGQTWYIYIQQIGSALMFDQINGGGNGNGAPVEHAF